MGARCVWAVVIIVAATLWATVLATWAPCFMCEG